MCETVCEEGYLVIESKVGDLSGRTSGGGEFCRTIDEAEAAARRRFQPGVTPYPVFVVKVTRFVSKQ